MPEKRNGEAANGHHPTRNVSVRTNGPGPHGSPSERVVERLEAELGELSDFALNDYVDPDALDALFETKADGKPRASGSVVFVCRGLLVTVHSDGVTDVARLT